MDAAVQSIVAAAIAGALRPLRHWLETVVTRLLGW
jgi:hypothetical protein